MRDWAPEDYAKTELSAESRCSLHRIGFDAAHAPFSNMRIFRIRLKSKIAAEISCVQS